MNSSDISKRRKGLIIEKAVGKGVRYRYQLQLGPGPSHASTSYMDFQGELARFGGRNESFMIT